MQVGSVGSYVTLLFQSKYQTFTPAQFVATFQEMGFIQTQGSANISSNPNAPQVPTTIFSKENLIVLFNPSENLLTFQIINTLDFRQVYDTQIQKVLVDLNFVESSVGLMGVDTVTQIHGVKSPLVSLTALAKKEFISGLNKMGDDYRFQVNGLRLVSQSSEKESLGINLEPLVSDMSGSYFLSLAYRTKESDKFNAFVKEFGIDMIKRLIEEVEKNV